MEDRLQAAMTALKYLGENKGFTEVEYQKARREQYEYIVHILVDEIRALKGKPE